MADRTQSILLQVAFKEAVNSTNQQGIYSIDEVRNRTIEFHSLLNQLAGELNINLESDSGSSTRELPEGANVFNLNGESWIDFRKAKDNGAVKAKHPDFKSFDYQQSIWMHDQEGEPNADAAPYVEAADKAALV